MSPVRRSQIYDAAAHGVRTSRLRLYPWGDGAFHVTGMPGRMATATSRRYVGGAEHSVASVLSGLRWDEPACVSAGTDALDALRVRAWHELDVS